MDYGMQFKYLGCRSSIFPYGVVWLEFKDYCSLFWLFHSWFSFWFHYQTFYVGLSWSRVIKIIHLSLSRGKLVR